MNTESINPITTLASFVRDLLNNHIEGLTVKEALALVEQTNSSLKASYRAVYQQLKAQGIKLGKGKFGPKQKVLPSEEVREMVAA